MRLRLLLAMLAVAGAARMAADTPPPPAFPGAEGFGASATGGRGGQVIYVTTTAASGPGSLQWAIDQPGPKYILFAVSGLIDARIHLRNGDATIAGQTSPGGITVRGFVTDESPFQDQAVQAPADFAENWILQHIRIRPGLDGPSDDGLRLRYTRRAIVDHVSVGNATDEAVEISYSNNITIQQSILAETLGAHATYGGVLINYSNPAFGFGLDNIALHHTVFARIEGRLPEASRESAAAAGSTLHLDLTSNLYWDPRFFVALAPNTGIVTGSGGDPFPVYYQLNAVNNYFHTATTFPYAMWDDQILRDSSASGNQLYVRGNRMNRYPTRSDYQLFYCCNDYAQESSPDSTSRLAQDMAARHPFPAITATPALDLATVLPDAVGAWPRDPMDTRLMDAVRAGRIDTASPRTNPAGDTLLPAFVGSAPAAPADRDGDGMPDAWEAAKGLNPDVAAPNGRTLSALGYTDLEVYLHERAASLTTPASSPAAPVVTPNANGSLTLMWTPVSGASSYLLFVFQGDALVPGTPVTVPAQASVTSGPSPLPPGTYAVSVAAVVNGLTGTQSPRTTFTVGASSGPAVPGAPRDLTAAVAGPVLTVRWSAPATGGQAVDYLLEAATEPAFAALVYGPASLGAGTSATLQTGSSTGTFQVRVRGRNAAGVSVASNSQPVTLTGTGSGCSGTPAAPASLTVTRTGGTGVLVSWSPAIGAASYLLQAASDSTFASIVYAQDVGSTTNVTGTAPAGSYWVRVAGRNACGTGAPSSIATVTLP